MRKAKLEKAQGTLLNGDEQMSKNERLAREKIEELEKIMPEMPRFEGFFKSMEQGKHPFEEDKYSKAPERSTEEVK